jgi:hypothetical protein
MAAVFLGSPPHVFLVDRDFQPTPPMGEWGNVSHVAVDSSGRQYYYRRATPELIVVSPTGDVLAALEIEATWPHGIYITSDDEMFLGDGDSHIIMKVTLLGEVLLVIGCRGHARWQQPFNHPTDIAVTPDGDILVSDGYANSRVHRFSADGSHLDSWGSPGSKPGQFANPHGIWVDLEGRVFVVDQYNHRVQVFEADGRFIDQWGPFHIPMDIWQDRDGVMYVSDCTPRLTLIDQNGEIITRLKTPAQAHGIWGDGDGSIYAACNLDGIFRLTRRGDGET